MRICCRHRYHCLTQRFCRISVREHIKKKIIETDIKTGGKRNFFDFETKRKKVKFISDKYFVGIKRKSQRKWRNTSRIVKAKHISQTELYLQEAKVSSNACVCSYVCMSVCVLSSSCHHATASLTGWCVRWCSATCFLFSILFFVICVLIDSAIWQCYFSVLLLLLLLFFSFYVTTIELKFEYPRILALVYVLSHQREIESEMKRAREDSRTKLYICLCKAICG